MTLKVGNSQTSKLQSANLQQNRAEKIQTNTAAENEAAINHLANSNSTNRSDELSKSADKTLTVGDFLRKIKTEQPFDDAALSKKQVKVFVKVDKPRTEATLTDYDKATWRAIFKKAGYGMLTDQEIALAVGGMNAVGWTVNDSKFDLENLRKEDAKPGGLVVSTNQVMIERTTRAGQAVLQFREYQSKKADLVEEYRKNYVNGAIGGFVQPTVNSAVNIINGVSEPFRAAERVTSGTKYIPEVPRMTVAENSEYWNKDGRMVINQGAEITSTVVLGGTLGAKAATTQAGRVLIGAESGYNIGAGITGKDVTQTDENGEFRQMGFGERALRITGGIIGARQTIKTEVNTPNSITNRATERLDDIFKNNRPKPQAEMVTPEGFRVKVNAEENTFAKPVQSADDLNLEMRWEYRINVRKGDGKTGTGLEYAWRRHGNTGNPYNKSIFSISKDELKLLLQRKDVVRSTAVKDSLSGNYVRQVDVGKIIGNIPQKFGGDETSVITIFTDKAGNLVNTFPGTLDYKPTLPK